MFNVGDRVCAGGNKAFVGVVIRIEGIYALVDVDGYTSYWFVSDLDLIEKCMKPDNKPLPLPG